MGEFGLSSDAFGRGEEAPRRQACDGEDVSAALSCRDLPAGTRSLVLIVEDPDAPRGTFTHWLAGNIEPVASGLGVDESAD